jgi:hypothetical protein
MKSICTRPVPRHPIFNIRGLDDRNYSTMDLKTLQIISDTYADILEMLYSSSSRFRPIPFLVFFFMKGRVGLSDDTFVLVMVSCTTCVLSKSEYTRIAQIDIYFLQMVTTSNGLWGNVSFDDHSTVICRNSITSCDPEFIEPISMTRNYNTNLGRRYSYGIIRSSQVA